MPVSAVRYRQATGKTTPIFAENETTLFADSGAPGAITNMCFSPASPTPPAALLLTDTAVWDRFFGGQFDKLPDGTPVQTIDLNKTCDPCGRGFSKTYQATGFPDQYYMASMFLPGELNPGAGARPMSIIFKGHVKPDEKTLAECNIVDGSTVRLDI